MFQGQEGTETTELSQFNPTNINCPILSTCAIPAPPARDGTNGRGHWPRLIQRGQGGVVPMPMSVHRCSLAHCDSGDPWSFTAARRETKLGRRTACCSDRVFCLNICAGRELGCPIKSTHRSSCFLHCGPRTPGQSVLAYKMKKRATYL